MLLPLGVVKYPPKDFIIAYPAQLSHLCVADPTYAIISASPFITKTIYNNNIITFLPDPPA